MSQTPYTCTAADLATGDIETRPADATVGAVYDWLEGQGYDVAPIVKDSSPIGYVEREALAGVASDDQITDHTQPITLDQLISATASFDEVLLALYESQFYFLGGRDRITGILTRADLNQSPAYIHLYDRLTLLEERFRELVQTHAPDWKDTVAIDRETVKQIEERYERVRDANIELDKIHYSGFATLVKIVGDVEACWQECGFSSADRASSQLDDLRRLRNAVAHVNLLIETTSEGLLEKARTIGELEQTYATLDTCLRELA